jgi:hypothetical protein
VLGPPQHRAEAHLHIYVGKDSKGLNLLYRLMPRRTIDVVTTQMKKRLVTASVK